MRVLTFFALALVANLALPSFAEEAPADLPGKKADGSIMLPNQWSLRPVGIQIDLGDGAVNSAMHPGGKYIAVQHAGYSQHEIIIVDLIEQKVASRTKLAETFSGIVFSTDGKKLFVSGGADETILAYDFADGSLSKVEKLAVRDQKERGIPGGIALQDDASKLYVMTINGRIKCFPLP